MKTLLDLYKWQVALAVALLYIVWPYVQTLANWMSSQPVARELVLDTVITFALLLALAYIAFTVWNDQRPQKTSRSKANA